MLGHVAVKDLVGGMSYLHMYGEYKPQIVLGLGYCHFVNKIHSPIAWPCMSPSHKLY